MSVADGCTAAADDGDDSSDGDAMINNDKPLGEVPANQIPKTKKVVRGGTIWEGGEEKRDGDGGVRENSAFTTSSHR